MARIEIDYNKVYHSKFDGDYIIIEEVKNYKDSNRKVIIKWLETGNKQEVYLGSIIKQSIRDKSKRKIDYNKIYHSNNYGDFIILEQTRSKNGHKMVKISFIDTGTILEVRFSDVLSGNLKDPYRKTICDVACIGNASSYHIAYNMWLSMIHRCYDKNCDTYQRYGKFGVTVCDKWLCFEYFLEDLIFIDNYNEWVNNPSMYHIDKDYKQQNLPLCDRVYSLETCCFLPAADNVCVARFEHKTESSNSQYLGVRKISDNGYNAFMSINGVYKNLGLFAKEELAACAYNNAANFYYGGTRQILNNVNAIDPNILIKYDKKPKEMCKII